MRCGFLLRKSFEGNHTEVIYNSKSLVTTAVKKNIIVLRPDQTRLLCTSKLRFSMVFSNNFF